MGWKRPIYNFEIGERLEKRFQDPKKRNRTVHIFGGVHGAKGQGKVHKNESSAFYPEERYKLNNDLLSSQKKVVHDYVKKGGKVKWHNMIDKEDRKSGLKAMKNGKSVMFGFCHGADNAYFPKKNDKK